MNIKVLFILFFLSGILYVNAQEAIFNNYGLLPEREIVSNQFVQNQNIIRIQQIGINNYAEMTNVTQNGVFDIKQKGSDNYVDIYKNAYNTNGFVSQMGSNNFISDYSYFSEESMNTNYNQIGNNLTIMSFGSNSISKNMQVNQTGNFGTVYIINH